MSNIYTTQYNLDKDPYPKSHIIAYTKATQRCTETLHFQHTQRRNDYSLHCSLEQKQKCRQQHHQIRKRGIRSKDVRHFRRVRSALEPLASRKPYTNKYTSSRRGELSKTLPLDKLKTRENGKLRKNNPPQLAINWNQNHRIGINNFSLMKAKKEN